MVQVLEEFLVNVKYNIDAPSQQTFFDTLKRISSSVAGVAGELTALSTGILLLSEKMAAAGEKLYWMSQRVGDSVTNIEGMSFALSNLGISAGEATEGIERFGAWTRNMGPAATGYLRSLGVTATDTVGRMRQLGEYFRTHGGTAAQQGSLEYSLALRRWQLMGGDERSMLALSSGQLESNLQQAGLMQRLVWGKNWQTGPQQFADQSVKVMNQFRLMGFFFENLQQKFGLGLFNAIEQPLKDINKTLADMLPHIETFLDHIISYAPAALGFLQNMMKAFDFLLQLGSLAMETWDKLPHAVQYAVEAILALPAALRLMGSPLFWILGGLTALLLLMDDYKHWQDDMEHPGQKTAYFDWGKIGETFKPFTDKLHEFDDFIEKFTGIRHGMEWIIGIGMAAMLSGFGDLAAKIAGIAAIFWGPLGIVAGMLVAAGGLRITGMMEQQLRNEAAAAGYTNIPGDPGVPGSEMFRSPTGEMLDPSEVAKRLGHPEGYVTWQELDPRKAHQPPDQPSQPRETWNLGIGDFLSRAWQYLWHGDPAGNTGASPTPGDPSARGIIPASYRVGGGDDFFTPERFYTLLLFSFQTIVEKLGGILDTLTDMATGQDAPHTARGGGAPGDLLPPGASLAEEEARLQLIMQRESGGQNIANRTGPGGSAESTASGYYQMLDSTWKHAAQLAGIDAANYPRAMNAPYELQHRAALALMTEQGERPWASSAPQLHHVPLGAGVGSGGGADGIGGGKSGGGIHNQTTIHVTSPSPASAAMQTAEQQERVFEHHVRFAKGALLA